MESLFLKKCSSLISFPVSGGPVSVRPLAFLCHEEGIEGCPARWGGVDTKKRSQSGWCFGHVLTQLPFQRAGYPSGVCAPEE